LYPNKQLQSMAMKGKDEKETNTWNLNYSRLSKWY
jgi:hypothetical protein